MTTLGQPEQAGGSWRDATKNGRSDYFLGYHPLFMTAKCLRRLFKKPYVVNGLGHFCGFVRGYLDRRPRINDNTVVRYVRQQQLRRLLFMTSAWR